MATAHIHLPRTHSHSQVPAIQAIAYVFGAAFLVVGILGFIPGVTTGYDMLTWTGHHSGAQLFGVFQVSALHNIVHLAFGVAGLLMGRTAVTARTYLVGGGVVYLALWIYGIVVEPASDANVIPVDTADNWLHLGIGGAMLLLGMFVTADWWTTLMEGSPQQGRPEHVSPEAEPPAGPSPR